MNLCYRGLRAGVTAGGGQVTGNDGVTAGQLVVTGSERKETELVHGRGRKHTLKCEARNWRRLRHFWQFQLFADLFAVIQHDL